MYHKVGEGSTNSSYFFLYKVLDKYETYMDFFFLMMRRPPRSTLFPLHDALPIYLLRRAEPRLPGVWPAAHPARRGRGQTRSEEHTSELQSLAYLVCRLLLEKKKNKILFFLHHNKKKKSKKKK